MVCELLIAIPYNLENKPVDFIDKLSDTDLKCGVNFISEACEYEKPFVGANQKEILAQLKNNVSSTKYKSLKIW